MITYKTFKENIGVKSLKWGNTKNDRAMCIYDGVKLFSKKGLTTQKIEKMSDEELYMYSSTYVDPETKVDTGEPVIWMTDKTGLKDIIEK